MSQTELPITCPSCQTVNDQLEVFCRECGQPIVRPAPLEHSDVAEEDDPPRPQTRTRRPRLVVVLGLWLLGFPIFVLNVISLVAVAANPDYRNRSTLIPFWLTIGVTCLVVYALYRVTKNYLTIPAWPEDIEAEDEQWGQ